MEFKTFVRETEVEGHTNWIWPEGDNGAWDGPVSDWNTPHRTKYLLHCKGRRTVVCAGGNCGLYPRLFADLFERVYTFEPDASNFHCLVQNCPLEKVVKINAALGNEHKMITLHRESMQNVGMHRVADKEGGMIPMLRLDDFVFEYLDLLQLDVEGYEAEVLKGAMNQILQHKPVIVTEMDRGCAELLQPLGYISMENSVSDIVWVHQG